MLTLDGAEQSSAESCLGAGPVEGGEVERGARGAAGAGRGGGTVGKVQVAVRRRHRTRGEGHGTRGHWLRHARAAGETQGERGVRSRVVWGRGESRGQKGEGKIRETGATRICPAAQTSARAEPMLAAVVDRAAAHRGMWM